MEDDDVVFHGAEGDVLDVVPGAAPPDGSRENLVWERSVSFHGTDHCGKSRSVDEEHADAGEDQHEPGGEYDVLLKILQARVLRAWGCKPRAPQECLAETLEELG